MSGYIYVIRCFLHEHENKPIYKVGKILDPTNPFDYLKSSYDPGFKLYSITRLDNISSIETKLFEALKTRSDEFEMIDTNMFKIRGSHISANHITSILFSLDDQPPKFIYEEKNRNYLIELEKRTPEHIKRPIRDVITKYYNVCADKNTKFGFEEFISHDELKMLKDIEIIEDINCIIDSITYKMINYKINPNDLEWSKNDRYIGCLSLKKEYTKILTIHPHYTKENLLNKFTDCYGHRRLLNNINVDRCFILAEFIEKRFPCVRTNVPGFQYYVRSFRYYVSKYVKYYDLFDNNNFVNEDEVLLAFFILGVDINICSGGIWLQNIVVDANHPKYIINFELIVD
jgi:hypothetical protein